MCCKCIRYEGGHACLLCRRCNMSDKYVNSQADLEYYFEQYPNLLCIVGEDGFLKKINPAVQNLLGYSDEELFNSNIDDFIHPDDREVAYDRRIAQVKGDHFAEYDNRLLTKDGKIVWLSWASVFIKRDQVFFSIAKDITGKKREEEQSHIVSILNRLGEEQKARFSQEIALINPEIHSEVSDFKWLGLSEALAVADQKWMERFESLVRKHAGKANLNLKFLSAEMAMSERQVYRYINRIVLMTPKKLINMVQLHMVWEMIAKGKEHSPAALARIAGFSSTSRFKKMFYKVYGIDVAALL
jgi:PAS domain S-box-containing protein